MPVVNVEVLIPRPAAAALKFISFEDRFPVSAEVNQRVPAHPIALRAESSNGRDPLAAGAEEWLLAGTGLYPGPQEAFPAAGEG
jgi:hypothetical protein